MIRSDAARRERVKTIASERENESAGRAQSSRACVHASIAGNAFILPPFRMESLFISRPVSSQAGTNTSVRRNKVCYATDTRSRRRAMGALDQRLVFGQLESSLLFYLDPSLIFHSGLLKHF